MRSHRSIILTVFIFTVSFAIGQVRIVDSNDNPAAASSSAFIDASSNNANNITPNVGKGLLFPQTDLTAFTEFSGVPVGIPNSYPTLYDGLIIYNTATGTAGIGATAVTPGFYYYSNQSSDVNGGQWIRLANQNDIKTPSGSSLPTTASPGDVFYNTTDNSLYYYKDNQWVPIASTPNGSTLPATADSKTGDLYYLTNSTYPAQSVLEIFNGTAWVPVGVTLDATGENYLSLTGQTLKALPIDLAGSNAIGILAAARFPALTGDVTTTEGSLVTSIGANKITTAMIQDGAVTTTKIADGAVTDAKIASGIDASKITVGTLPSSVIPTTLPGVTSVGGLTLTPAATGFSITGGTTTPKTLTVTDNATVSGTNTGDITLDASSAPYLSLTGQVLKASKIDLSNSSEVTGVPSMVLEDLTNVSATSKANGDVLQWDGTNSKWVNNLASGIDGSKITGTLPNATGINGVSIATAGTGFTITGGTTPASLTVTGTGTITAGTTSVSGTNTGDQDASKVNLNPSTISGITGTTVQAALTDIGSKLSQKLDANSAITASSGYSIVNYDTKGLVINGKVPTTDDISDASSTTNKYVTPAQLTVLSNTSGTNTGDQKLSVSSGKLTISATGSNSVNVVTSLTAGSGLSGTGTTGDITLSLGTNAVAASNLTGSSGALASGTAGHVLQSNGDGTFSWKDLTSGVSVNASSLTLPEGYLFVGNSSNVASAQAQNTLSLGGFSNTMGSKTIQNLADPTNAQDAATKNYVDTKSVLVSQKGAVSGVAPLNASGIIDSQYLPSSLVGAVTYVGTIDLTKTTVPTAAETNKGNYYVCTTDGGTYGSDTYYIGDWIISDGSTWSRVANHNAVTSVLGKIGAVTFTTDEVNEGTTNLYYKESRVNANATVVALGTDKEDKANKSTDGTFASADNTYYPSTLAVKTYVDSKVPSTTSVANNYVLTVIDGSPTWKAVTGSGVVKNIAFDNTTNNGITGTVDNVTDPTIPKLKLTLGDLQATSLTTTGTINGSTIGSGATISAGASVSGSNTGDQTISFAPDASGDVTSATVSSTSSLAPTLKIKDGVITPAKLSILSGTASAGSVLTYSTATGFAWSTPSAYTLPIASASSLGGIMVGDGLSINSTTGVLTTTNKGTVTSVSVTTNAGVSGTVDNPTSAPAIKLSLGAITPTSISTGNITSTGTITATGTITGTNIPSGTTVSGSNTGDQTISLTGDITGTGNSPTTSIPTTIASGVITPAKLSATNSPTTTGQVPSYDLTTGKFTWVANSTSAATSSSLGLIQMTGDLSGTGTAPKVASVGGSAAADINTATIAANGATSSNTNSTIVKRDASGNFSAGTITASLIGDVTGNATTATTAVNIASTGAGLLYQSAANTTQTLAFGSTGQVLAMNASGLPYWATAATGTVTSVGLTVPSILASTPASITTNGTFTVTLASQTANTVFAAPSGSAGTPTFRKIVATDISGTLTQSTTGNAATATTATTATNATNSAITDNTSLNSTVYPTWVTTTTGNLPLYTSSTKLTLNPSTGTLTAKYFSGDGSLLTNLNATNLTSGTISTDRYGASSIPVTAINATGTASSTTFLAGDGTWKTGGGATNLTYVQAASTGTLNSSTGTGTTIPEATTSYAGLLNATDKTKLSNIPTISGAPNTTGQVLTYNSSTANASWVLPGLQYTGTTGTGVISITNGGTSATIPVASSTASGLMIPTDKTKLDTYPTISNTPTSGQVLASNGDGTATWTTSSGSSGGSSSTIYNALSEDGTSSVAKVLVKGSGSKVRFWIETASPYNILHISIPSGSMVDYIRILISKADITQDANSYYDFYLAITDASNSTNTGYANALMPNFQSFSCGTFDKPSPSTGPWLPTTAPFSNLSVTGCENGTLTIFDKLGSDDIYDDPGGACIILSY